MNITSKQALVLDALGNAVRRDMLGKLAARPHSVSELGAYYRMSRPAVSKHLKILSIANLVKAKSVQNRNEYSLVPEGFEEARSWLDAFWDVALNRLAMVAENSED
ncbi:ArsR/SmtB family transcription factor [Ruegeria meonggei]|uniref:HTH-type transcriptional regulator n=1 Tax=Ruegeria meonggei TaxID=1446476 RepID=A0A1X7ADA9_9RHOB|nr:metalloregulator ArsR/SmtB family transcription factor [Ruegeria meonggei]SLN76575.1 HTH-type transcriptional regulator [Ruegeria meonggei]